MSAVARVFHLPQNRTPKDFYHRQGNWTPNHHDFVRRCGGDGEVAYLVNFIRGKFLPRKDKTTMLWDKDHIRRYYVVGREQLAAATGMTTWRCYRKIRKAVKLGVLCCKIRRHNGTPMTHYWMPDIHVDPEGNITYLNDPQAPETAQDSSPKLTIVRKQQVSDSQVPEIPHCAPPDHPPKNVEKTPQVLDSIHCADQHSPLCNPAQSLIVQNSTILNSISCRSNENISPYPLTEGVRICASHVREEEGGNESAIEVGSQDNNQPQHREEQPVGNLKDSVIDIMNRTAEKAAKERQERDASRSHHQSSSEGGSLALVPPKSRGTRELETNARAQGTNQRAVTQAEQERRLAQKQWWNKFGWKVNHFNNAPDQEAEDVRREKAWLFNDMLKNGYTRNEATVKLTRQEDE